MPRSAFREAKLKRMFDVYDVDNNGYIERKDYETVIDNFAAARGLAPGSKEYEKLETAYLTVWEGLRSQADTNRDDLVSFDEMLAYNEDVMADPAKFEEQVLGIGQLLFELLDSDGDGYVKEGEYLQFAECLRFEGDPVSFARLDTSGSGMLSKAALMDRIREFYLSDDENAAGNWLFGDVKQRA